jgi:hypothetical protein
MDPFHAVVGTDHHSAHVLQFDAEQVVSRKMPQAAARIKGYEVTDRLSDHQPVALARAFFLKRDRMAGVPTPT